MSPWLTVGRVAGRRPAALDVDDDAGDLRHAGVADGLLLEGESRAAGRRHDLVAGQRGADDRAHRGDLVLHLDELAALFRQPGRQQFGNLGGGSNRVAGEKIDPGIERPLDTGLVTLDKHQFFTHRFHPQQLFRLPDRGSGIHTTGSKCNPRAGLPPPFHVVQFQHVLGAEPHTDAAALAPFTINQVFLSFFLAIILSLFPERGKM